MLRPLNVKFNVVMRTYESHAATHENLAAEMAAGTAMDYNWAFVGTHMPVAAWQKWLRDGLVVNIGEYVAAEPDRYPVLTELFKDPYWRLFNYKNNNGVDNNYAMWSAIVQKAPRASHSSTPLRYSATAIVLLRPSLISAIDLP